jgi:N-methylhydantoinase B/oxoprolinase/acetone carboxylase alpha subunit
MTNSLNTPVEALENYLPVRIRRYGLRPDSGGRGRFNGGEGIVREYEFLVASQLTIISERRKFPPYGLEGGRAGAVGKNTLIRKGRETALGSKFNLRVEPGDILRVETPGGGGYGRPGSRASSHVGKKAGKERGQEK